MAPHAVRGPCHRLVLALLSGPLRNCANEDQPRPRTGRYGVSLSTAGCYATVDPEPVGYADVSSAPVNIETYPSVVYEGHPAYFYGDHWWYCSGSSWSYYHSEPAELHRQRAYVQRAPAARRAPERAPEAEHVR
jgi:hypothetical protein